MSAIDDVIAERERQKAVEGWTPEHDDRHDDGSMAAAAACYAHRDHRTEYKLAPVMVQTGVRSVDDPNYVQAGVRSVPKAWPWQGQWWKPKDRRRDLVRAAALLVAEIERIDRNAARHPPAVFMEYGEEVPL